MIRNVHSSRLVRGSVRTAAALAIALSPTAVLAQTEAPAPAPAAEAAPTPGSEAPAPAADPTPAIAPVPAAPAVVAQETGTNAPGATPPATLAETVPPPTDESQKPLNVAVWGRIGNTLQNRDGKKLDDLSQNAEVNLLMSGSVHKYVKWQSNFVATYGGAPGSKQITGNAAILDLIGQLEFHDTFNVWFGRMLVPSDRSNFSGAWFMSAWNYPGLYPAPALGGAPAGPRQGPSGRNDGATVWGQFGGGVLKYYLGAFDLHDAAETPLFTSRINLSLINPEPGYYHSSTYYGGKDILAIAVGAQFKKDGSAGTVPSTIPGTPDMTLLDDYTGFNADVLFEKKLGDAGTVDLEAAFYLFDGENEVLDNHFYGLVSYLTPTEVGIGRLQPLVRFQGASPKGEGDMWQTVDAQLGYVMNEYAARLALGYQYTKYSVGLANTTGKSIFLGLQLQK